ncbi:MAG: copper chaperone PCu(A)C [Proteobacteria bacterium]|nr:copper chaperone PCu(A)C [Pseudomonadota bacterium]
MMTKMIAVALLLASSLYAQAHDYTLGSLKINHPWARATAPGAAAGGGFLKIDNSGAADRLVSAQADVSSVVELHTMMMEGNVMRMSKLERGIDLPAGQSVALQPGGLHIMFIDLKAPLKEGDKFPLKLKFEKAGEITVDVHVAALGAAAPAANAEPAMSHMHQH